MIVNPCRNSQRILHIPFFPPKKSTSPAQLQRCEIMLKQARMDASASFGVMIAHGNSMMPEESQDYIDQVALECGTCTCTVRTYIDIFCMWNSSYITIFSAV